MTCSNGDNSGNPSNTCDVFVGGDDNGVAIPGAGILNGASALLALRPVRPGSSVAWKLSTASRS